MSNITRSDLMAGAAGLAAAGALGMPRLRPGVPTYTPEDGASLRLLRWVPFVKGEEEAWNANTQAFTEATGVEVRIDQESWEDVRPKAAVAANVGSGPDMVMSWFDDPFQYPDKLVDVTELADGGRRGERRLVRRPAALCGARRQVHRHAALRHRQRHLLPRQPHEGGGLHRVPEGQRRLPRALQGAEGQRHARRLPARQGGRRRQQLRPLAALEPRRQDDQRGRHGRRSTAAETRAAIEYAKELYATFIPGTESWLDINNNRAFLAGQVSLTANGVSLYYAANKDPALAEIAEDIRTTNLPIGPVGKSVELHQTTSISIFNHTKYPQAAMAYLAVHVRQPRG